MMNLGVYIQRRLFQRGELVYRLRIKTHRGLGHVIIGDILVGNLLWCCASRSLCVKQMSSVLHRRSFHLRSEGGLRSLQALRFGLSPLSGLRLAAQGAP